MPRTRKAAAAQQAEETLETTPAEGLNPPQAAQPSQPGQPTTSWAERTQLPHRPEPEENPFPGNLKTAVFGGGYKVRLDQVPGPNPEMRIQFGSGLKADKPSEDVLDIIRNQEVPEKLMTAKEREAGESVAWFKFRGDPETGAGTWRMWMRNHPKAARTKAEQVYDAVVAQIAKEIGTAPQFGQPAPDR
jgi:hypothetical protein